VPEAHFTQTSEAYHSIGLRLRNRLGRIFNFMDEFLCYTGDGDSF